MKYKEEINAANSYREEYLNSIDSIISSRHEEARKMRAGYFEKMKHNMEEYRREFVQMLGWPLTEYSFLRRLSPMRTDSFQLFFRQM